MTDILEQALASDTSAGEDPLNVLVGEGKKFRSPSDLAKAKLEADSFIEKLKSENRELRTIVESLDGKVKSQDMLTELIERVSKGTAATTATTNGTNDATSNTASTDTRNQSVALTPEDVLNLLEQREKAKSVAENRKLVNAKLAEMYGDKAVEVVRQRAAELGLTDKAVFQLAESSPKAFLKLVSSNVEAPNAVRAGGAGKSTVNSQAVFAGNVGSDVRNDAYYAKLKSEMGAVKFALDTNMQVQMHKDMERLGDAFFSNSNSD